MFFEWLAVSAEMLYKLYSLPFESIDQFWLWVGYISLISIPAVLIMSLFTSNPVISYIKIVLLMPVFIWLIWSFGVWF